MADDIAALIEAETDDDEPIGFLERAESLLQDFFSFGEEGGADAGNRGPAGCATNQPTPDGGTLARGQCQPPGPRGRVVRLDPIVVEPIRPFDEVKKSEKFEKKFKVGADVYWDLGLAGQIAEKFLELPYRTGKIEFKSGKLQGKGLVCSSFAKIFGALWFAGDPTAQERPMEHAVHAKARHRRPGEGGKEWKIVTAGKGKEEVLGESDSKEKAEERARLRTASATGKMDPDTGEMKKMALSSAQVYAGKYEGSLVNVDRLKLQKLVDTLDKTRLYAVVKYDTKVGETRGHVLFLIYSNSNSLKDWVMIHSPGKARSKGGRGSGPGIYEIPRIKKGPRKGKYKSTKFYQAWDWGPAYRPRNPDIDHWDYVP